MTVQNSASATFCCHIPLQMADLRTVCTNTFHLGSYALKKYLQLDGATTNQQTCSYQYSRCGTPRSWRRGSRGSEVPDGGKLDTPLGCLIFQGTLKKRKWIHGVSPQCIPLNGNHQFSIQLTRLGQRDHMLNVGSLVVASRLQPIEQLLFQRCGGRST